MALWNLAKKNVGTENKSCTDSTITEKTNRVIRGHSVLLFNELIFIYFIL
jgi:hypothetical protein